MDFENKFSTNDINTYVEYCIRHKLGGFETDDKGEEFKYLLKNQFEDIDGSYRAFFTGGVDNKFEHHFDKSKQSAPQSGEPDNRKDVFDELTPIMLAAENCRAKILFPYNTAKSCWLTGELVLEKKGNTMSVLGYAHYPHGKGYMDFKSLGDCIRKTFTDFNVDVTSKMSPFTANRQSFDDDFSSGVIVAEELVKRIANESLTLSMPYAKAAQQLCICQIVFIGKFSENVKVQSFINNVFMEEDNSEYSTCLSIEEIRCEMFKIIDSNDTEMEKIEELQQLKEEHYKPLVIQLAHQISLGEFKDLVIVFKDLITMSLTLGDLTSKLGHFTEAGVLCQYMSGVLEEKFSAEQRNNFAKLYSINPSQRWNEIQRKSVTMIGGNLELLPSMTHDEEEYSQHLKKLRMEARQKFELVDSYFEHLKKSNPQDMDDHQNSIVELVRDSFENVTAKAKSLIGTLFKNSEKILNTPPPCRYAIVGLGALTLQQPISYSNSRIAILTELDAHENPEIMEFFKKLSHLAILKTIGLGETVIQYSKLEINLDHITHFAQKFNPMIVQTVPELLKNVYNNDDEIDHTDYDHPKIWENVCYVSGDKQLFEEYQEKVTDYLNATHTDHQRNCEVRALTILKEGADKFEYPNKKSKKIEIDLEKIESNLMGTLSIDKPEIYRLSERMVYNLGLYFGIEGKSCWDTVDKLKEAGIINARAHANLQYAVSLVNFFELKTIYKTEKTSGVTGSKPTDEDQLFNYFNRVCPLFNNLKQFCSKSKELTNSEKQRFFHNETFFESNSATKGFIYYRLEQYDNALKHLSDALQASSQESKKKILVVMGFAYLEFGEGEKAIEVFETLNGDREFRGSTAKNQFSKAIGVYYHLKGNFDKALEYGEETLKEEENLYRTQLNPAVGDTLNLIGLVYRSKGDLKSAKVHLQKSLAIRKILSAGSSNLDVADSLINIAGVHLAAKEFELALEIYESGSKLQTELFKGAFNLKTAQTLNAIGHVHLEQDDFNLARTFFEKCLQIIEIVLKNESTPEIASYLNYIGLAFESKDECNLALKYLEKSLKMRRAIHTNQYHPDIATSHDNVGRLLEMRGSMMPAMMNYFSSLVIRKHIHKDTPHLDLATSLHNIGRFNELMGKDDLALEHWKESLCIRKAVYKDTPHLDIAVTSDYIGRALETKGEYDLALPYWKESLDIRTAIYKDVPHASLAFSLNNVGLNYQARGENDLAFPFLMKSLTMAKELYEDVAHHDVAAYLTNIGIYHKSKGEYELALAYFEESLATFKVFYKNAAQPDLAGVLHNIGGVYYAKGENDLALQHLEESLDMFRTFYDNNAHPNVALALISIGDVHKAMGEHNLAVQHYKESIEVNLEIFDDPRHPKVAAASKKIMELAPGRFGFRNTVSLIQESKQSWHIFDVDAYNDDY